MSASEPGALCYQLPDGTWDDKWIHEELLGESLEVDPAVLAFIERNPLSMRDYNPNQPRVPKGSGDPSGQWAGRFEEPTPASERARAMREEEANRATYEARYAELWEKEKKRVAGLAAFANSRAPGESDKAFAKRVIDKRDPPDRLPQVYDDYFDMKPDTQVVPVERIISSKSAEETVTSAPNAAKRMAAAANGELSKRDPISVRPLDSGSYKVLDGNSTYAAARHYGWTHLPVQVLLKDGLVTFDGTEDMDFILQHMRENDIPITRDAYIEINWPALDAEWDASYEAELPQFLQDWSLFEARDGQLHYKHRTRDYDPNPNRHPEGTPGGKGGEFAPKGGGSYLASRLREKQEFENKVEEEHKKLTFADIDRDQTMNPHIKPRQPSDNVDEIYDLSKRDEVEFVDNVKGVARATGGEALFTPPDKGEPGTTLKKKEVAIAKIAREYEGDAGRLVDVVRGTVAYDTIAEARYGAEAFIRASGGSIEDGGRIIRVKDRIANVDKEGYRDILVSYQTKSGTVSEIQFNAKPMLAAKEGRGHAIYEAMNRQGKLDPALARRLHRESVELYDRHYERSGNGTYGKKKR